MMKLGQNLKINLKGNLGIDFSSKLKNYYSVGQDKTTKIISEDFKEIKNQDNDSEYFYIKKLERENLLIIGGNLDNKGVLKKVDPENLKIIEEIFSCENEFLEIVENKGIFYCLLKNGIQIFSLSDKKTFFYEEENISKILKNEENIFFVVNKKLEKLVLKENDFVNEIVLDLKNDFNHFLIFDNNLVCSQNEKLFMINFLKKELIQIEDLTDSETIEKLLYVKNNEILIFSNNTLFWVDLIEKNNIAYLDFKNKPLFLLNNNQDFIIVDKSGIMQKINFDRNIQIKRKKNIIDEEDDMSENENKDDINIEAALADFDKNLQEEEEKKNKENKPEEKINNPDEKKTEKIPEIEIEKKEKTEIEEELLDKDFIVDDLNPKIQKEAENTSLKNKKKSADLFQFMGHYPNEIINPGSIETKLRKIIKKNPTGSITSYLEPELNNIEIEFSDHDLHSKILMENTDNIIFGDLNEKGFILASYGKEINEDEYEDGEEDEEIAKLIFKSINSDNEWTIEFPFGVNIEFISLSYQFIYVVDNLYNIRIYSFGGVEIMNFSLGSIICLASFEHLLAVVQQKSLPIFGRQNLVMTIFNVHTMEKIIEMDLALSPYSNLRWFGFSDEGVIYTQDSEGVIRMQVYNNYWIIVHKPKSQRKFWLFGVMDKELIGFRLMVGEKVPDVFKKYSVFRLMPKCETISINKENPISEEGELIYSTADFLNEKYRYEQFKHIKHTVTKNVLVNIFKEKILTPEERFEKEDQIEQKKVEFIRKLLCEGKEQAALFQSFQLKKEEHFQVVIQLFEKLKFKKLADQLKEMAKENGFMMRLSSNTIQTHVQIKENNNYKRVQSEQFNKYFEDKDKEDNNKGFFMEERDKLMNVEDEPSSYVETSKVDKLNVNKRQKKVIDNDLFGALGSLQKSKRFK